MVYKREPHLGSWLRGRDECPTIGRQFPIAPAEIRTSVGMESAGFNRALGMFSQSQEPFDVWFKQRLAEVSGVDLGNLPPGMQLPELVSSYEA